MGLARRKSALGTRRARRGLASFRSALTALTGRTYARRPADRYAYQQALARPVLGGSDAAAIAADLKATFGDAAGFCAHIDDKGAPTPQGPCNHCDDQCPLCPLVAQAAAFVPPAGLNLNKSERRPLRRRRRARSSARFPPVRPSETAPERRLS